MEFTVRTAQLDDLDTLVSFTITEAHHAEGKEVDPDKVRKGVEAALVDPSLARYWVLQTQDGEAIGSISVVNEWSNWYAGYYWWIQSLFIMPDYRGQKLMGKLIEAVRKAAKEENALDIRLLVYQDNPPAKKAYLREGFSNAHYEFMTMKID